MWWDADTIERTVTRAFVCKHLLPDEIARLDRPLGFGDGLTDGTYWEWIDQKAKKLFLLLVDLGVPDQIFGVIDDSWDDDDLPVAREHVERLALTAGRDDRLERKFYQRQFHYLLTPLEKDDHTFYQDADIVPLDVVDRSADAAAATTTTAAADRVTLPNYPGRVFLRRRLPLGPDPASAFAPGFLSYADFFHDIAALRPLRNDHLVSYWASYAHQGWGYVLFSPASDGSLKSLLATTPASLKALPKRDRRQLLFNWIHCLVDTLCFLHARGLSHGNIKPSTVLFNHAHHVFFASCRALGADLFAAAADKSYFDKESYDYAAPEQWYRPPGAAAAAGSRKSMLPASLGSPGLGESAGVSIRGRGGTGNRTTSVSGSVSGSLPESCLARSPSEPAAAASPAAVPQLDPQAADVFSLGCLVLELVGFMLKRPTRAFATHRAAKHKTPGRGGAVLDSSFHKNLGQVESWMGLLAREAAAKTKDDPTLAGVAPLLRVVQDMLAPHPADRLSAFAAQARLYEVLRHHCGIAEPHCVHQYGAALLDGHTFGSPRRGSRLSGRLADLRTLRTLDDAFPDDAGDASAGEAYSPSGGTFAEEPAASPTSATPSLQSRSSAFHARFRHRPSSIGGASRASASSGASGASGASAKSAGSEKSGLGLDLSSGLQAIRNLQIRDKVRPPWNGPAYTGTC